MKYVALGIGLIVVVVLAFLGINLLGQKEATTTKSAASTAGSPFVFPRPQPDETGSYAYLLEYNVAFLPATEDEEAQFVAVLSNNSDHTLDLFLNPTHLHASLVIIRPDGSKIEAYPRDHYRLMMTSSWIDPVYTLEPLEYNIWHVPLSKLVTHLSDIDGPLTEEMLAGSEFTSEITVGVIPAPGGSVPHATLRSDPTSIPSLTTESP